MKINQDLLIGDTGKSLYSLTTATKAGNTASTNRTSDLSVSSQATLHSFTLNVQSGRVLMTGSLALRHGGGTPQIRFTVDGVDKGNFFASRQDEFYSFSQVVSGLSKGNHTFALLVIQGNASGVVVCAYTATELSVIEV